MTNEEKDLLIAYLVDTGDIDPDGDVEAQFLEWYQVRDQVVSGEAHYKVVLEAARVRQRSYQRGYRTGGSVRWHEGEPLPGGPPDLLVLRQEQKVCDHDTPCGCHVEGYAAGIAEATARRRASALAEIEKLHRVLDHVNQAAAEAAGIRL
jgi:hypothetical protein